MGSRVKESGELIRVSVPNGLLTLAETETETDYGTDTNNIQK